MKWFFCLLSLSLSNCFAKTFSVCSAEIPLAMTADNKGPQPLRDFYNEVIKKVEKRTGHKFNNTIAPAKRCTALFYGNKVDIAFPFIIFDDESILKTAGYDSPIPVYSMPVIMGAYLIFTKDSNPKINDIKDLKGKKIVVPNGYGIPAELQNDKSIKKIEVTSNEQITKMLGKNRGDAGVIQTGWVPILKKMNLLKGFHHGKMFDFWGGSFALHQNNDGVKLSNAFNNVILELISDGTYEKIMTGAPYYIPSYQSPNK